MGIKKNRKDSVTPSSRRRLVKARRFKIRNYETYSNAHLHVAWVVSQFGRTDDLSELGSDQESIRFLNELADLVETHKKVIEDKVAIEWEARIVKHVSEFYKEIQREKKSRTPRELVSQLRRGLDQYPYLHLCDIRILVISKESIREMRGPVNAAAERVALFLQAGRSKIFESMDLSATGKSRVCFSATFEDYPSAEARWDIWYDRILARRKKTSPTPGPN